MNVILRDVRARGGIASLNHADAPGGEICMGCKWEPPVAVDMSLFTGVEAINGGNLLSSADFWDGKIADGIRLTAIGGSDNHNALIPAGEPSAIGRPTTVVEASDLSVPAILDGIRRGRVFVDLTSSRDKTLDIQARDTTLPGVQHQQAWTAMGDALDAASGHPIAFRIVLAACPHSRIHLMLDGRDSADLPPLTASAGNETLQFKWTSDGRYHWLRCEVRDNNGQLSLLSNPIYINLPKH